MVSLISIIGPPGVGKTTIANCLSEKMGIYFLDRDILLNHIFGDDRESDFYKSWIYRITKSTWELGVQNAVHDVSSILESPMTITTQGEKSEFIDNALKQAELNGFFFRLIYCIAPAETILSRLKARGDKRDFPKFNAWEKFVATYINVPGPNYEHLKVNTSQPLEGYLNQIFKYIQ